MRDLPSLNDPSKTSRPSLLTLGWMSRVGLACWLMLASSGVSQAQLPAAPVRASQLPSLGDGSELTAASERRLGDRIAVSIFRDPDYIDDPVLGDYVQSIWQPLVKYAASADASFAFSFASTNLVIMLGLLVYGKLGWPLLVAERIGGSRLVSILMELVFRKLGWIPPRLSAQELPGSKT